MNIIKKIHPTILGIVVLVAGTAVAVVCLLSEVLDKSKVYPACGGARTRRGKCDLVPSVLEHGRDSP